MAPGQALPERAGWQVGRGSKVLWACFLIGKGKGRGLPRELQSPRAQNGGRSGLRRAPPPHCASQTWPPAPTSPSRSRPSPAARWAPPSPQIRFLPSAFRSPSAPPSQPRRAEPPVTPLGPRTGPRGAPGLQEPRSGPRPNAPGPHRRRDLPHPAPLPCRDTPLARTPPPGAPPAAAPRRPAHTAPHRFPYSLLRPFPAAPCSPRLCAVSGARRRQGSGPRVPTSAVLLA